MAAAGVPVEIGMIDRAEDRARTQELGAMREGSLLAARTLGLTRPQLSYRVQRLQRGHSEQHPQGGEPGLQEG